MCKCIYCFYICRCVCMNVYMYIFVFKIMYVMYV